MKNLLNHMQQLNKSLKQVAQLKWVEKSLNVSKVQKEAIRLITIEQLYNQGVPGEQYSPYTIELKKSKGQPYDRVTLRDEGDFYRSFTFEGEGLQYKVFARDEKGDKALTEVYGIEIIELSDENKKVLAKIILPYARTQINQLLFKRA